MGEEEDAVIVKLKDSGKGMNQAMTKGKKITLEERIEIVDYCLQHQKNYHLTAEILSSFISTGLSVG